MNRETTTCIPGITLSLLTFLYEATNPAIESHPGVTMGKPVIRGTRITVQHILGDWRQARVAPAARILSNLD